MCVTVEESLSWKLFNQGICEIQHSHVPGFPQKSYIIDAELWECITPASLIGYCNSGLDQNTYLSFYLQWDCCIGGFPNDILNYSLVYSSDFGKYSEHLRSLRYAVIPMDIWDFLQYYALLYCHIKLPHCR